MSVDEFARLAFLEQSEVSFPLSVVQFGVLMVVMDSTMEFVGMLLMPRIYSWVEGTHEYSTAKLAIFCLRCYLLALAVALVVGLVLTPCILDGPTTEFSWPGLAMGRRVMTTCKSKTCGCADASDDGHFACAGNPSAAQWLENTRGESCCYFNASSGNATVDSTLMYVCPAQESNMCFLQPAALAWVLAAVRWIFYGFVNQASPAAPRRPPLRRSAAPRPCPPSRGPPPRAPPPVRSSRTARARWARRSGSRRSRPPTAVNGCS